MKQDQAPGRETWLRSGSVFLSFASLDGFECKEEEEDDDADDDELYPAPGALPSSRLETMNDVCLFRSSAD